MVAPLTADLRGHWGSVHIDRSGYVRTIREFGSPQLAYADARKEWRQHVDFISTHSPLTEKVGDLDNYPVNFGRQYILRCRVGLPWDEAMWCAVRFSADGELADYRKIGASAFYDLGSQTFGELNLDRGFIPDEMEVRHDILAVDFVPQVQRQLSKARTQSVPGQSRELPDHASGSAST